MKRMNLLRCTLGIAAIAVIGTASGQKKQTALAGPDYQSLVNEAYAKHKDLKEGKNADYIPALAQVPSDLFGVGLVTTDGKTFTSGDITSMVSIQSISKVFALARVIDEQGADAIEQKVGVDATGEVFNSITAVERMRGKEINSCVNPGAIATTSLVKGGTYEEKWANIINTHSDFAGRQLEVNVPVYDSEAATNQRNQAIAHLLFAYERMYWDPVKSTDLYTKQCAINVSAKDLAMMAATLANGGTNPVTGKVVVSPNSVEHTLAVMATAGLYDDSGIWLYHVGLPGKSGVGGGIIAVCPGKFGIGVVAPPLDAAGNSVKGQKVVRDLVDKLNANLYSITPKVPAVKK
ncbi:MAG: glutaminase A [Flavobacteriales bacterium]|nr:glutaminase A [Flavobacteriales bacterium]